MQPHTLKDPQYTASVDSQKVNFDLSVYRTVLHFASVRFNELWSREYGAASGLLDMELLLRMTQLKLAFVNCTVNRVHRRWFL